jgi:hypothetical protein
MGHALRELGRQAEKGEMSEIWNFRPAQASTAVDEPAGRVSPDVTGWRWQWLAACDPTAAPDT